MTKKKYKTRLKKIQKLFNRYTVESLFTREFQQIVDAEFYSFKKAFPGNYQFVVIPLSSESYRIGYEVILKFDTPESEVKFNEKYDGSEITEVSFTARSNKCSLLQWALPRL